MAAELPSNETSPEQMLLNALHERLAAQLRPPDVQRLWQSVVLGMPLLPSPLELATCLPGTSNLSIHPLFQHGLCAWPGCDQPCDGFAAFIHHLNSCHTLDDRTTQLCRAQIEVVENLEHRLGKERLRLQAMMQHLHMKHSPDTTTPSLGITTDVSPMMSPKIEQDAPSSPTGQMSAGSGDEHRAGDEYRAASAAPRRRISDKSVLPIDADIARNRDFYRTHDVRPPYTYASLIRQAIMESKDCQLTLNEIYQWFTETFAYFRRNAATWKNAVRHNLSLHKCFARVEQNVKGAVWTVDDSEFYRRRQQRGAVTSRSTPCTPRPSASMDNNNPLSLLAVTAAASFSAIDGVKNEDVNDEAEEQP